MKKIWVYIREYWIALRVLSLTLALAATTFGMLAAWRAGYMFTERPWHDGLLIGLITIAGLCSQAGANLINDYFEGSFKYVSPTDRSIEFLGKQRTYFDVFVFLTGIGALGLAGLIGLYLVYITDWIMLLIGIIGLIGSYAYTGEPFVYKQKGLGVPLSFLLMGPLMTFGAYYPFAQNFSWYPILLGLPVSLFVPALMISNEMRDFKRDHQLAMGTLSVRIGSTASLRLFELLAFGPFVLVLAYVAMGVYPPQTFLSFLLLPIALKARRAVKAFERLSIPNTNRLHLGFFIVTAFCLLIW